MKRLMIAAMLAATTAPAMAQTVPAPAFTPLGPDRAILSVTGEGQSRRTPDIAIFSAGVVTQGTTAGEALGENSRRMESLIAALKRSGVADRDIQTSSISIQPRYSNPELEAQIRARETRQPYVPPVEAQTPRIIGYEARNSVQIRARQLGNMGRIIDTLVQAGSNQIDGPNFMLDDQKAALNEARTEAVADARAKADLYARAAGMRVVRIVSIAEGGGYYPVQQVFAASRGSFASPAPPPPPPAPVAPGELTLGTNVSVQFELSPG